MGSCCRSLWRSWPLFPDSRQGCWLRSIHRGLGISLSGPFSGMLMSRGTLGTTCPWQNRSQGHTNLFIRGWQFMYKNIILFGAWCLCEVICSILFSSATKQARMTPNRSALYDPQFRNEKETCYIQKSDSPRACSPNLPGGSSSLWPI